MKIAISSLFALSLLIVAPSASFAKKKCKKGYVWDAELSKCVKDYQGPRGSH